LYDATVSTVAGIDMMSIIPMYAVILGIRVLTVMAAARPNVTRNPKVINVADFAFPEVGNPSLKIPAARNINPINMVSILTACIPSVKVWAIPESEIPTPTIPMDVSPIPGVIRSQSDIL
jgi:hypothetical protein